MAGQSFVKIESKDHYFYDESSKVIYYIRRQGEIMKFSTGIKFDGSEGCLIRASRIVTVKEKEKREKVKKPKMVLNKLMGEYIDDMTDRDSEFHLSKKAPISDETMESYKTSKNHLKDFFEAYLPNDVKDSSWKEFTESFQVKNPEFNMFNVTKHFRTLTKFLHSKGIMTVRPNVFNPNSLKEKIKRKKKRHRIYSTEEILLMDAVCNEDQRLCLWLGYDMAFRTDDCINLEWTRVHFGKNPFIEFHGDENKTGFTGRVPLSDSCASLLKDRKKASESAWVFPLKGDQARHMLGQQIKFEDVVRASVNYGSHQILRHTRLTEDFGNTNLDNALVMKIRRVSLAVALEHYIHPSDSDLEKFRNTGSAKVKQR